MTKKFQPNISEFEHLNSNVKDSVAKLVDFAILVVLNQLKKGEDIPMSKLIKESILCGIKLGIDSSLNLEECYNCNSDCSKCRKRNSILYKSAEFYASTPLYIKAQAISQSAKLQEKTELQNQLKEVKQFL